MTQSRNPGGFLRFSPVLVLAVGVASGAEERPLSLTWEKEMLTIRGPHLPGGELPVWYMEAFCRPGSTDRDWKQTVIPHQTRLVEASADRRLIRLRSELEDGVVVDHQIRAGRDEVDFVVVASNPRDTASEVHWAQPCVRVDRFTGTKSERASEVYLPSSFIFIDGKLTRMPTLPWAKKARYIPGQVWCPAGVDRNDVNPRPLSAIVPSNGLIGCFSADGKQLMATAWEPYQELFQGVIVCLHSDFRIGGLQARQTKTMRGKIYLMPADVNALLARYRQDFPGREQVRTTDRREVHPRKLIEFGWDEPDTAFMKTHQRQLESAPFDGCVFHANATTKDKRPENFTWLGWGRRQFAESDLAEAFEDLRAMTWTRMRHNFLRFNVTPGDLDWFESHEPMLANARLAARLARAGKCEGILLDTEQYEKGLFNYRRQRDRSTKSWHEYAVQVRARGREFMTALQDGFPGLTLLVTFGPSLIWLQSQNGETPLPDCDYGLLVPFFDGMVECASGQTRIIDGYEQSYGYKEPGLFDIAHATITIKASRLMQDPAAYARVVSPGFGLWLDYDWRAKGWKTDQPDWNYFSPGRFQTALRAALERSNEYVWIYTETPRWWSPEGGRVALPQAYVTAVQEARRGLCPD